MASPEDRAQINLRLSKVTIAAIDARSTRHGRTRNEWLTLAVERVLSGPTQIDRETGRKF